MLPDVYLIMVELTTGSVGGEIPTRSVIENREMTRRSVIGAGSQ